MSNTSAQIIAGLETTVETAVSGIAKLRFVNEIERNDFRSKDNRYGVKSLGAESVVGQVRTLTIDHDYEIALVQGYVNVSPNDYNQLSTVDTLHDRMDDIAKAIQNTKIGLSSIVRLATLNTISEPEYLTDEKVVIIRAIFTIKYSSNL